MHKLKFESWQWATIISFFVLLNIIIGAILVLLWQDTFSPTPDNLVAEQNRLAPVATMRPIFTATPAPLQNQSTQAQLEPTATNTRVINSNTDTPGQTTGEQPQTLVATATPTSVPVTNTPTSMPTNTATVTPNATTADVLILLPTPTPTNTVDAARMAAAIKAGQALLQGELAAQLSDELNRVAQALPTITATPSATPLPTVTNSPTSTSTPTASATVTQTPTATATATKTPSSTATATATNTPTPTQTPTRANTATRTPTQQPTHTATVAPSSTTTATNTPTMAPTSTPTIVPTKTPSAVNTLTRTPQPTRKPTSTATALATATEKPSPTPTVTNTATATPTNTPSPTASASPTATATTTNTPTPVPTHTATITPTPAADTSLNVRANPLDDGSIGLTWSGNADANYDIYSDMGSGYGVPVFIARRQLPAFEDETTVNGSTYRYSVQRIDQQPANHRLGNVVAIANRQRQSQTPVVILSAADLQPTPPPQKTHGNLTVIPAPTPLPPDALLLGIMSDASYTDEFGQLNVVGEVRNDANLDVGEISVVVSFYDANGNFIEEIRSGTPVETLSPSQRAPFHLTLPRPPGMSNYSVKAVGRPAALRLNPQIVVLNDKRFEDSTGFYHVAGKIQNVGSVTMPRAKVVVTLYTRGGGVVNVGFDYPDPQSLAPGDTAFYDVVFTYFPKVLNHSILVVNQ